MWRRATRNSFVHPMEIIVIYVNTFIETKTFWKIIAFVIRPCSVRATGKTQQHDDRRIALTTKTENTVLGQIRVVSDQRPFYACRSFLRPFHIVLDAEYGFFGNPSPTFVGKLDRVLAFCRKYGRKGSVKTRVPPRRGRLRLAADDVSKIRDAFWTIFTRGTNVYILIPPTTRHSSTYKSRTAFRKNICIFPSDASFDISLRYRPGL